MLTAVNMKDDYEVRIISAAHTEGLTNKLHIIQLGSSYRGHHGAFPDYLPQFDGNLLPAGKRIMVISAIFAIVGGMLSPPSN